MPTDPLNEIIERIRPKAREPKQMLTIRVPLTLHEALRAEAIARECSLNSLALAKLMVTGEVLDAIVAQQVAAKS